MNTAYLNYIFSLLLFGTNGIVANYIDMSSEEIVLLRTFIGSLLLIGIFFLTREKFTFYKHKKTICLFGFIRYFNGNKLGVFI